MSPKQRAGPPMTLGSPARGAMAELLRRSAATVATLIAGLCCWPAPSEAYIEHPWCTRTGTTSCGFDSYEQCMENARLLTQTNCVANPWIHPLPQAPPHAHGREPPLAAVDQPTAAPCRRVRDGYTKLSTTGAFARRGYACSAAGGPGAPTASWAV